MAEIVLDSIVKRWKSSDMAFELQVPYLRIVPGEMTAIIGENGTGKSTLLEIIGLATAPDEGVLTYRPVLDQFIEVTVLWRQRQLARLAALRGQHFGYVLQSALLLPFLSVQRNGELAQEIAGRRDSAYLHYLLEKLGLMGREKQLPVTLSPGLRQRAAIACALAHRPVFVLADEPTASLDPTGGQIALELLLNLSVEQGTTVVIASHDQTRIEALGMRILKTLTVKSQLPGLRQSIVQEEDQ